MSKEDSRDRIYERSLGLHESSKEVLAVTDFIDSLGSGVTFDFCPRLSDGSVYLYAVLESFPWISY